MITFFALLWLSTWFTIPFWIIQFMRLKENERIKSELERAGALKGFDKFKYKIKSALKKQNELEIKPVKYTEKQLKKYIIASVATFIISFIAIGITAPPTEISVEDNNNTSVIEEIDENQTANETISEEQKEVEEENNNNSTLNKTFSKQELENNKSTSVSSVPAYSGNSYVAINNNVPFFANNEITNSSYENYSSLDALGRCGIASACIGKDIMPTEERGDIGSVKPTGWHSIRYQGIDGNYLYNRCHLIGFQLAGENANEKNLITGTRYLNVEGMLPFENMVADYVKETNNHVLYRVTPVFEGNNLLASGVLMEAYSVEDNGAGIQFCVYCYNVQPGITIDYVTGDSSGPEYTGTTSSSSNNSNNSGSASQTDSSAPVTQSKPALEKPKTEEPKQETQPSAPSVNTNSQTYILNTNTKKFHEPSCGSAARIKASNKSTFNGSRDELISRGYSPCGNCHP